MTMLRRRCGLASTPPWKGGASRRASSTLPVWSAITPTDAAAALSGWPAPHLGKVGLRPGKLHTSSVECRHTHRTLRRRCGLASTPPWKGGASSGQAPHFQCGVPAHPRTLRRRCGLASTPPWKGGASSGQAPHFQCGVPSHPRTLRRRCGLASTPPWKGGASRRASSTLPVWSAVTPTDAAAALWVGQDPTLERWGFAVGKLNTSSVECRHTHGRCGGVVGWSGPHLGKVGLRCRQAPHFQCGVLVYLRTLRRCCRLIRTPPWKGGASLPGKLHTSSVECWYTYGRCRGVVGWPAPHLGKVGLRYRQAPHFQCGVLSFVRTLRRR